jgi:hypothetical protein
MVHWWTFQALDLQAKFHVRRCLGGTMEVQKCSGSPTNHANDADEDVRDAQDVAFKSPFKILDEEGICRGYKSTIINICYAPSAVAENEEDVDVVCSIKQRAAHAGQRDIFHIHLQVGPAYPAVTKWMCFRHMFQKQVFTPKQKCVRIGSLA